EALGDEAPRDLQIEREGLARAGQRDIAELISEALAKLGEELGLAASHDRLADRLVLRPHDGGAVALERQNGKGTAGQEMLHCLTLMRARMRDGGDDADLRI